MPKQKKAVRFEESKHTQSVDKDEAYVEMEALPVKQESPESTPTPRTFLIEPYLRTAEEEQAAQEDHQKKTKKNRKLIKFEYIQ